MSSFCSNSCIVLHDGNRIYCENDASEMKSLLKISHPDDEIELFPSDLKGKSMIVCCKDIYRCEYTD